MEFVKGMNLYPWIEPFVLHVMEDNMNLVTGRVTVKDVTSSNNLSLECDEKNDTFTLCIPHAGSTIYWQVLFNGSEPEDMPDFIIPDHDGFDPDYEDIPALLNWNPKNPLALLLVVKDLLKLFKIHQLQLLKESESKISKDLETLLASRDDHSVEVLLSKDEDSRSGVASLTGISILIQLRIDISDIPEICYEGAPPKDPTFPHPVLFIKTISDSGKIRPSLYMSPRLEYLLGGRNAMKLPPYHNQSTNLQDYVQTVQNNLQFIAHVLKDGHTRRREYIAAFLCQCSDSVLEYDAADFNTISLLFTFEDFHFIVHVYLNRFFPLSQPMLTLQSVYHVTRRGTSYQVVHSNYPYSPRWQGSEMVKRARSYILEQIGNFRTGCLKNGII